MDLLRSIWSITPEDVFNKWCKERKKFTVYLGIDPTSDRLHIGHAVSLFVLKRFLDQGHTVKLLMGGFTASIGDPTGRDDMREKLPLETVHVNGQRLIHQVRSILPLEQIEIFNNRNWLRDMTVETLFHYAEHFTLQQLEDRDMFERRRLEGKPISIPELLVPILQGIDSFILDVDIEIGGSDQLFNMLAGRKLAQQLNKQEKVCITTKIINGIDGRKMSKTYDNCIWLEDTPKDKFGKTMKISDPLVYPWAEVLAEWTDEEIAACKIAEGKDCYRWKIRLAHEIVRLFHGEEQAKESEQEFRTLFKVKI